MHIAVQQKPTQYCKAIIFQLKNKEGKGKDKSLNKERVNEHICSVGEWVH